MIDSNFVLTSGMASVDDQSDRIAVLKSESARTRLDFMRALMGSAWVLANLVETERRIGDLDGARLALQRAEGELAKGREFLSNPKHQLTDEVRQGLTQRADSLRTRLDGLRSSMV